VKGDWNFGGARLPNGRVILTKTVACNVNDTCRADSVAEPSSQRLSMLTGGLGALDRI
jgi:hypothetical protein